MNKYTVLSLVCLALSVPLAFLLVQRRMHSKEVSVVRFATFNASLHRDRPGALLEELRRGDSAQARQIAAIVQRCEVDVLLLCELDRDEAQASAEAFATQYLAVPQDGGKPIDFAFRYVPEVNTGAPSGLDLDGDGANDGPGDAWGFGRFPGQYGMAILSRHPIVTDGIRTFRMLPWSAMPGALRPDGYGDDVWGRVRLSSKNHLDVPIRCGGTLVHALCSHPTPPAFDGPEDRNGRRNHDEIRFWVDYLTPGADGWIVDDRGGRGGLAPDQRFVLLGDLNCDPVDGDARPEALRRLLAHERVADPAPRGLGGGEQAKVEQWAMNSSQRGEPELDTADFEDAPGKGPGNLRVDYVLPSRSLPSFGCGVFWPQKGQPGAAWLGASDHRLVWVDVEAH